jgi:hypothetical protein
MAGRGSQEARSRRAKNGHGLVGATVHGTTVLTDEPRSHGSVATVATVNYGFDRMMIMVDLGCPFWYCLM